MEGSSTCTTITLGGVEAYGGGRGFFFFGGFFFFWREEKRGFSNCMAMSKI